MPKTTKPTDKQIENYLERKIKRIFGKACEDENCTCGHHGDRGGLSCIYWLGFFGAAFYFLTNAPDLWSGIIGLIKAFLWPAFVTHGFLVFLGL